MKFCILRHMNIYRCRSKEAKITVHGEGGRRGRIVWLVDLSMPLERFKKITYPKKLAAAKGNVVKEVEPKIGEAALPAGTIKIDSVNDELTVLSYEGLSPAFDGNCVICFT
ncbi:hypothetical protein HanHA89_Chr15g0596141 [Helianthus annuus]|nr:hypothetical protein HanHA89_Chr15g0596141 [Helianthus annuus]